MPQAPQPNTDEITIIGQRITRIRMQTPAEQEAFAWYQPGPVIELQNGILLTIAQDPEGNGPGWIDAGTPDGKGGMIIIPEN